MNINSENEIKLEVLDLEYDSYQQDSQIFPSNETSFNLAEGIKNEELDEKTFIKSEKEFIFVEELVKNDVIKSENQMIIEKKFCSPNFKIFLGDVDEVENGSKIKNTLKNKPQTSVTDDQSVNKINSKYFTCIFCDVKFISKYGLKIHLKTHVKKCAYCSFNCYSKLLLKQHLLIHGNIKLFKCIECNFECNQKQSLNRHMHIHGKVKLFKCCDCSYQSNLKQNLKRHMLVHGNVKLFKCCKCSYACNQKVSLKRHLLNHENIRNKNAKMQNKCKK